MAQSALFARNINYMGVSGVPANGNENTVGCPMLRFEPRFIALDILLTTELSTNPSLSWYNTKYRTKKSP